MASRLAKIAATLYLSIQRQEAVLEEQRRALESAVSSLRSAELREYLQLTSGEEDVK